MAVLVGIDEAGFGPILGPLVVSSAAFSLGRDLLEADLWQVLRKSVADKRKHLAGRLLIVDSKKAYSKALGIKHLQRTTLSCLRHLGEDPATLTHLMSLLCPHCLKRLGAYPWYKSVESYNLCADKADIAIASGVFQQDLESNGIRLLKLSSDCLDVAHYNKMVSAVKNKARVLFNATARLIQEAFDNYGGDDLQIIVDRQGGRVRYRKTLGQMFPGMELEIIRQSKNLSSYELKADGKKMRLHFTVAADKRFFPVSLASMVSKYQRELLVDNINHYFTAFHADLKPTAGYWKDGLRFIDDLKNNIPDIEVDNNQLIRCR